MFVDGVHNSKGVGLGVIILDHVENCFEYAVRMDFKVTNNVVEYEVVIFEVMTSKKLGANSIILHNDSQLVIN